MPTSDSERLARLERAVGGLGREVEAAKIAQTRLAGKQTVLELKEQIANLADQVAELPSLIPQTEPEVRRVDSWLARLPGTFTPAEILADLIRWVGTVHLRYADAATELPECWLWHPEVVEELLWLMQAWRKRLLRPSVDPRRRRLARPASARRGPSHHRLRRQLLPGQPPPGPGRRPDRRGPDRRRCRRHRRLVG